MRYLIFVLLLSTAAFAQVPPITPGVSQELAKWRASHYSDVRYKLNLTLEKMSPVLKGSVEIRVKVEEWRSRGMEETGTQAPSPASPLGGDIPPIILDWRRIVGHEDKSTISKVTLNGREVQSIFTRLTIGPGLMRPPRKSATPDLNPIPTPLPSPLPPVYRDADDHLVFSEGVQLGENVIKLDFTSPILTSGAGITRYIDKEDGSEYIYSLFVPSDASTAFPVFDQPDLKAKFELSAWATEGWKVISNGDGGRTGIADCVTIGMPDPRGCLQPHRFSETKPISTYVFAFAAGPFEKMSDAGVEGRNLSGSEGVPTSGTAQAKNTLPTGRVSASDIYVRKSQAAKFQPHAAEVFRLNRESIKYFEEYFDYKFPFPKYDLVLIPEFPFGGMEHAGATFLRESAIIFPQEPTKSDHISRAVLIFHEAAHQWFGDTVTMKWFDDLWLKEGFANFMAYKAVDKIMPEANAWKVFYERIKQPAYATDSTRGTTPIYQPIDNLNSAKSAYGNIVYNKAPAFLKQAEFYLGPEKFQTAVRAFLKKHEFKNAKWEDLVFEFKNSSWDGTSSSAIAESMHEYWTQTWIRKPGVPTFRLRNYTRTNYGDPMSNFSPAYELMQSNSLGGNAFWEQKAQFMKFSANGSTEISTVNLQPAKGFVSSAASINSGRLPYLSGMELVIPNYQDYGYGIFLLDNNSREYVLKNVQNEKDAFLRSMMYGALWDSVREGELDPRTYVDVAIKNLPTEQDETIAQMMTSRSATALNYYMSDERVSSPHVSKGSTSSAANVEPSLTVGLRTRFESVLIERIKNAPTLGQRITFFRTLVANATTESSREFLKRLLGVSSPHVSKGSTSSTTNIEPSLTVGLLTLRTKDKFDIVTRLAVLNDPDAAKLLAELEKTETTDDAKRYAYAARAAFPTKENREKYWNDFVNNKDISESWIEAAFGPFNAVRNSELSLPFLRRALEELPNHKRNRKIFFVNGWLGAFIGGQRSLEALDIVNKFLTDNPNLDKDLRLKILENVDVIERGVKIRTKFAGDSTQRR